MSSTVFLIALASLFVGLTVGVLTIIESVNATLPGHLGSLKQEVRLPSYCKVDFTMKRVRCVIPNGVTLDYETLKLWTRTTTMDHTIFIECETGGVISLPWPMRARHIVILNVKNCVMTNFFKDMALITNIPDKLSSLVLTNSTIKFKIDDVVNLIKHFSRSGMSKESKCGQQTLRRYIFRDIIFDAKSQPMSYLQFSKIGQYIENFIRMSKLQACNYFRLNYLDESDSRASSIYHFQLLTTNSLFPVLRTYRSSNVGLQRIPKELVEFTRHFPCISLLDLSFNFIRDVNFTFEGRTECRTPRPIYINLRYNNIAVVPVRLLELFLDNNVIIDIRDNPVHCPTQTVVLRNYVTEMKASHPRSTRILNGFPCLRIR